MPKTIAFIPARGGSKSIPGKNIKNLAGQPLIYWTIQELVKSEAFDEIWVSTDSEIIAGKIHELNLNNVFVFDRDANFAQDTSSTEDAMIEFINEKKLEEGTFVLVQATSPFTTHTHFTEALDLFKSGNYNSLLTGVYLKRFLWNDDKSAINYDSQNRPRRQDFKGTFMENGAFYISSVERIKKFNNRLSGEIALYEMPEYTSLEIDEELDWFLVEQLMKKYKYVPEYKNNKEIKLFATDVDGVLTDAGMYYTENGDELKKFNTLDGKAFELLRHMHIKTAIITSEETQIVSRRAKKIKSDFLVQKASNQGKLEAVKNICEELNIDLSEVAYIGDDINCREILENVGLGACPSSAVDKIKSITGINILSKAGGEGVFREFVEKYSNNEFL